MAAAAVTAFGTGAIITQPDMVKLAAMSVFPGDGDIALLPVYIRNRESLLGRRIG